MFRAIKRVMKASVGIYFLVLYLCSPIAVGILGNWLTPVIPISCCLWFALNLAILGKVVNDDIWEEIKEEFE